VDEYAAGWRQAARWAKRDDMLAAIGSPAYERYKAFVLQGATAEPVAQGEAVESWKDRALKAEEVTDRLIAEINDMTGPTFMGEPVLPRPAPDVDAMVTRFLGWKLPDDFAPDNGISFTHITDPAWTHDSWPIGTNLLTAAQAEQMFRYALTAAPSPGESQA